MTDLLKNILLTAVDNAREGITVSDATLPHNPLIYVNKGFTAMTGYTSLDSLGKNCRFLQGANTQQEGLIIIRAAMKKKEAAQVELINFKKDGTAFHNRLSITPVFDDAGKLTNFIGIQEDISMVREKEKIAQQIASQHLILQTTTQAQEQEREIIGKELHDNINQLLATSRLLLNIAVTDGDGQKELVKKSSSIIDEAIEEIRKLTKRLVLPEFTNRSLVKSLQLLIDNLQPALPFLITLTSSLNEDRLDSNKKLMFHRITQEALNNAIKYARPKTVFINLKQIDGHTYLEVRDDGVGFDKSSLPPGIGLRNINQRLEEESGRLELITAPGEGCCLKISIPA